MFACPNKSASITISWLFFKNIFAKKCLKACGCIFSEGMPQFFPHAFMFEESPREVIFPYFPIAKIPDFPASLTYALTSFRNWSWKKKRRYLFPLPFNVTSPEMMSSHVNCMNSDRRAPVVPSTLMKK